VRREEAHGGHNAWYPMADNARYRMPDDGWYIHGRLLTARDFVHVGDIEQAGLAISPLPAAPFEGG
jgi:hypothetical protein